MVIYRWPVDDWRLEVIKTRWLTVMVDRGLAVTDG
jgi:hypothetical protein